MSNDADEINPYAAPKAKEKAKPAKRTKVKKTARPEGDEDEGAREAIQESLRRTRPWIMLFGVLTVISAILLAIAGILSLGSESFNKVLAGLGPVAFLVYVGLAAIYVVVAMKLFRYRDSIDRVVREDGRLDAVAYAIERQREFWAFVGGLTVVVLGLYLVVLFGVFLFAVGR